MIRTPLGQWINENDISRAGIKLCTELINEQENTYKDIYTVNINCISNNLDIKISPDYDTKEEAQSKLDRMFAANRCK